MTTQVSPMSPPAARTFWSLGTILLVPVLVSLLVFYLAYSAKNVRFEVSDQGLRIEGDRFYGRQFPPPLWWQMRRNCLICRRRSIVRDGKPMALVCRDIRR